MGSSSILKLREAASRSRNFFQELIWTRCTPEPRPSLQGLVSPGFHLPAGYPTHGGRSPWPNTRDNKDSWNHSAQLSLRQISFTARTSKTALPYSKLRVFVGSTANRPWQLQMIRS